MEPNPSVLQPSLTRDESGTLLGQTMGLVAVTTGLFALGAYLGRDLSYGWGFVLFLAAGLIDHMHVVVVPIVLGRGARLWDGLEGIERDFEVEAVASPSGVTHLTFARSAA